jgi:PAS domain S-box-containing protein
VTFNPPPWNPALTWDFVPLAWVHTVSLKHFISAYIIILFVYILMSLGSVRKFFGLKKKNSQKDTNLVYATAFFLGIIGWLGDSLITFLLFNLQDRSFWEIAILNPDQKDFSLRLIYVLLFAFGGIFIVRMIDLRATITAKLEHKNNVLMAIRKVNQLIAKTRDKEILLQEVCEILVDTHGYFTAWIVCLDDGKPGKPFYHSGFNGAFHLIADNLEKGEIPACASSAFEKDGVKFVENPSIKCPFCPLNSEYNTRSNLTGRLFHNNILLGWISVSLPRSMARDKEEQDFFYQTTGDISLALYTLESDAKRLLAEHDYSAILSSTKDAIISSDKDGYIILFNKGAENLFDCPAEEALGAHVSCFCPSYLRDQQNKYLKKVMETGESDTIETQRMTKLGKLVEVEINISRRTDNLGNPIGVTSILRDISQRKNALQKLKKSEAKYRLLLENQNDVIVQLDLSLKVLFATPKYLNTFFRDQIDDLHKDIFEKIHEDHQKMVRQCMDAVLLPPYQEECISRVLTDAGWRFYNWSMKAIFGDQGQVSSILCVGRDVEDQLKAENALSRSEAKYRAIFENSPLGMFRSTPGGRFIEVNPALAEMLGYETPKQVLKEVTDIAKQIYVSTEDRWPIVIENMDSGGVTHHLNRYRRKDGSEFLGNLFLKSICDDSGDVLFLEGIVEDITERRAMEEALRKSEHQKNLILNATVELVAYQDLDWNIVWANHAAAESVGLSLEELIGRKCYQVWGEAKKPCAGCPLAKARQTKKPQQKEIQTPDGRYWLVRGFPVLDDKGEVQSLVEFAQDITETRKAEQSRTEAEERFYLAFDTSPDAVNINRLVDGLYVNINQGFTDIMGYTPEDAIGKTSVELDIWADPKAREELIRGLRETGRYSNLETLFRRKDGSTTVGLMSASVMKMGGEEYILSITRDIGPMRKSEEEKAKLEESLRQAQKMEAIGRLAGGIAHDMNNMISPIIGYSEMLLEDLSQGDYRRDFVDQVFEAGQKARDLVRQLLAFSRKQNLEYKLINLTKVLKGFEKLLRKTIREDITLTLRVKEENLPIYADIGQVEQVVMNLVVNAQDAMPTGGEIIIELNLVELDDAYAPTRQDVKPGSYAQLAVRDTGQGMDQSTKAQLFEPFFSTKGEMGTGLGLSTVYGIVKQHGAHIWVYSEPGNGAVFKIYFPISTTRENIENSQLKRPIDVRGNECILLVEDNVEVRNLAENILRRQGYELLIANNGIEALEILDSVKFSIDLMLTDVVMPQMNGRELYEQAIERQPDLKVIYMSGYMDDIISRHGISEGEINFIQKPFAVSKLTQYVRKVLDE